MALALGWSFLETRIQCVIPPSLARGAERRCCSRSRYVSIGSMPFHSLELSLHISRYSSGVG